MKKSYWIGIVICLLFIGVLTQLKRGGYIKNHIAGNNKLTVTTSIYPLYYFASRIAGDKVEITNITPSVAEPHDYELTPGNIISIQKSKLLILNGGYIESWGDKIKDQLKDSGVQTLVVSDGIVNQNYTDEVGKTSLDPHIWLDPILAKEEAAKIETALVQLDPGNRTYYQNNLTRLNNDLDKLDQKYRSNLASCKYRDIITSHAAFGYLAKEYGLKQVAIAGLSPDAEPSPSQLAVIARFAKDNDVKYIFFESLISPKLSQTIALEIGAKTLVLNPIEGLTPDDQKSGKDYLSIMNDNLANLKLALQCK